MDVLVLIKTGDGEIQYIVPGYAIWYMAANLPKPCRVRFIGGARDWDMSHVPWTPPAPDAAGEIDWKTPGL